MKRFNVFLAVLAAMLLAAVPCFSGDGCISSGLLADNAVVLARASGQQLCSVLIITDGTNAATVTVYDNAVGGAGKVLFKGTVPGASNFGGGDAGLPVNLGYGIYMAISGTGANAIVYYR
jgi:hypothetical protein